MARRYFICYMPVQHLNGKLAPSSLVCHNQPDSSESPNGFYYGYRHQAAPNMSRFGLREKARNLSVNPYTQGEEQQKALFSECVGLARQLLASPTTRPAIEAAFKAQRQYTRLYNYTVATLIKNGAQPPW